MRAETSPLAAEPTDECIRHKASSKAHNHCSGHTHTYAVVDQVRGHKYMLTCSNSCHAETTKMLCLYLTRFACVQSIEDWIQDFKQFLVDSPYSTALEDMYPDVHVHTGFLQQLQAVTDKAPNATQNIGNVLMDMSGGVSPSLVIVTGTASTPFVKCM